MNKHLFSAASAAALSLSLLASGAAAQDLGLKQLQDSAVAGLSQLSMDTSMVPILSLEELTQIQAVTGGADSDAAKMQRIETIMRDAEARIAAGGSIEPSGVTGDVAAEDLEADMTVKANVGAFIAQLGLADEVDVEMLSTEQLLNIQLIDSGNDSVSEKRTKVEVLLSN